MGFLEHCFTALRADQRRGAVDAAALTRALRAFELRVRTDRPALAFDEAAFATFLVERLPAGPPESYAGLRAGDLCLAWACLNHEPSALAAFEAEVMPKVSLALRGVDPSADFVREAANGVRVRLLLQQGSRAAGLTRYLGQGPLASFAMVVALREAIDRKRQVDPSQPLSDVLSNPGTQADEALDRRTLKAAVQGALGEAMAALTPRQRTLLRLHLVQGVSAEKLAKMYGVHRATTTRWIADARQQVLDQMTGRLKRELKVGSVTFAELTSDLVSRVDVTLSGMLSNAEPLPADSHPKK